MRPLIIVLTGVALLAGAAEAATPTLRVLPPAHGIYHAASPGFCPEEDCVSAERVRAFEALAGKRIVWAYFSDNWFGGIRFPDAKVRAIWSVHHTIPFIRLMARGNWDEGCRDHTYPLAEIIGGRFDAQLRGYARAAAATAIPLLMEFGTEVNGDWFPWSGACNGGARADRYGDPSLPDGPERFRDAYRHIVILFRGQGARNVTWVFHVNAESSPEAGWNAFAGYYPGSRYVDWVGISAYGAQEPGDEDRPFESVFAPAYRELAALAPDKPIALLEFGSVAARGIDKAGWIRAALGALASGRYPRVKAESYWHSNWPNDNGGPSIMRIDSSPAVLAAYRKAIADPIFVWRARLAKG